MTRRTRPQAADGMRYCFECEQFQPVSAFGVDRQKRDGLASYCRACVAGRVKQYRNDNLELVRWKDTHRSKPSIRRKRTRERRRYWSNPDKYKAQRKIYNATHPGLSRRSGAKRRQHITLTGSFTASEWEALKAKYGYRCLRCGKQEPTIKLVADHIIPVIKRGAGTIENIQPLCQRCNLKKFTRSTDYRVPLVDVDLSTPEDHGQLSLLNEECDSGYCFL